MKILVALPMQHPKFTSIESVLAGEVACSGTYGTAFRLASLLKDKNFDVCLSADYQIISNTIPCISHEQVNANEFDYLIVHQSHWNGHLLTFGNQALPKTSLWVHVKLSPAYVHTFLQSGGSQVICPSTYNANYYRALSNWQKVRVISNTYSEVFSPLVSEAPNSKLRLLYIGAITESKGIVELTKIWSYLVKQQVNLELAIAGSRALHCITKDTRMGPMGLAEYDLELNCIKPWLDSLPLKYQPQFLGSLPPLKLREEIAKSWAVIVNPAWRDSETFCVSAVEAQACDRTVFSVAAGGLKETVYQGEFGSLARDKTIESLGALIIEGLSKPEVVELNGKLAGQFVRDKFNMQTITTNWICSILGDKSERNPSEHRENLKDLLFDLLRWSGKGITFHQFRHSINREVMTAYKKSK